MKQWLLQEKAQDLIEYALGLPLMLLIFFTIIEAGILFFDYNTIANAAREGARTGILPNSTNTQIETAARALTAGLASGEITVVIDPSVRTLATVSINVRVTYRARLITGPVIQALGGTDEILLSTDSTMRLE